ncbi:hypothetical protein EKN56_16995 [Limnobaculum zhutongyuii]|uniref:Polysaccharide biosynthesis protein n=1 Tax=Limnobaculum zhutongyuii TaxID=2498113 RepID=A0A411WNX9_9GAMM|nr:oligosaccharide flippase family protein [Limnobaculum zhutongyuii]QBH97939.1 hypothetical protein EKN56_16995 [Limnobaculum zhutongyuii]TQS88202.1 hypothetical protein ELQ32_11865 [Limnobaculum zhutongyuii]
MSKKVQLRVAANLFGKSSYSIFYLLSIPYLKDLLGVDGVGVIGLFVSLQVIILLLEGGMTSAFIRGLVNKHYRSQGYKAEQYILSYGIVFICISLVVGLGMTLCNNIIVSLFSNSQLYTADELFSVVRVMGWVISCQFIILFYEAIFIANEKQIPLNFLNVFYSFSRTLGAVFVLLYIQSDLIIYFYLQLIINIIYILLLHSYSWLLLIRKSFINALREFDLKKLSVIKYERSFGRDMFYISILSAIAFQSDRLFISKNISLYYLGIYNIAYALASAPTLFTSSLYNVVYPRLIKLGRESLFDSIVFFKKTFDIIILIIVPICIFSSINSGAIIYIWMGEVQNDVSKTLKYLIIATLFLGLQVIPYSLQIAREWTKLTVIMNIILLPILLTSYYIMSVNNYFYGISLSWMLYNILSFLIMTSYIYIRALSIKDLLKVYLKVSLSIVMTAIIGFVFKGYFVELSRLMLLVMFVPAIMICMSMSSLSFLCINKMSK